MSSIFNTPAGACRIEAWIVLTIFLFFILINLETKAQEPNARAYYEFLWQEETAIGEQLIQLSVMLKTYDVEILHRELSKLKNQITLSIERVENQEAYPKSKYVKEAFLQYLETLHHLCKDDFKKLIDLIATNHLTEDDKTEAQKIMTKVVKHMQEADEAWQEAKTKFAEKHQFSIPPNSYRFYLERIMH